MAITRNYVYNATSTTNIKNIYDYLVANAVPKYFDSVYLSEDGRAIGCLSGGIELVTISLTNYGGTCVYVHTEGGALRSVTSTNEAILTKYIWTCNNAICLSIGDVWAVTFTKDNDNNTAVIFTQNCTVSTTAANQIYAMSAKSGDINSITITNNPDRMKTALCPIIIGDTANYTPNVFLMPYAQNRAVGILDINGDKYMTNGLWCIKD